MSSALSAQLYDTSHPNVPIREMTKQNLLEDKEAYLREGGLGNRTVLFFLLQ
jgi:hypothetical protein